MIYGNIDITYYIHISLFMSLFIYPNCLISYLIYRYLNIHSPIYLCVLLILFMCVYVHVRVCVCSFLCCAVCNFHS